MRFHVGMRLSDTHCHLDLYPDFSEVIEETERAQIETVAVTNTPSVFRHCAALLKGRQYWHPALGLHPELAVQRKRELSLFSELLPQTRFVGEVGLDFVTPDAAQRRVQTEIFESILDLCARSGNKILTIHSRRAAAEVVERIGPGFPGTAILHWYSGSLKVAKKALEYGCYFSINPAMTISDTGRRLVAALPKERVLLETDGPFVKVEGCSARPRDVARAVSFLATLWNWDEERAAKQVEQNLRTSLDLGAAAEL